MTTNGTLMTVSPVEYPDLYWALAGGGGGTYGVVISLTVRAHPDNITGGLTFAFLLLRALSMTMLSGMQFYSSNAMRFLVSLTQALTFNGRSQDRSSLLAELRFPAPPRMTCAQS
jgi:hypothetical protein